MSVDEHAFTSVLVLPETGLAFTGNISAPRLSRSFSLRRSGRPTVFVFRWMMSRQIFDVCDLCELDYHVEETSVIAIIRGSS